MVRFCRNCLEKNHYKNFSNIYHCSINDHDFICPVCGSKMKASKLSDDEYESLILISHDQKLLYDMAQLKKNNPIDFYSKMGNFKTQIDRKSREREAKANIPHCPTCGSTNIEKIRATKKWLTIGLFGIGSSDIGKTMHCRNCGYKW